MMSDFNNEVCQASWTRTLVRKLQAAGRNSDAEHMNDKVSKLEARMLAAFPPQHSVHRALSIADAAGGDKAWCPGSEPDERDRFSLIDPAELTEVSKILTFGLSFTLSTQSHSSRLSGIDTIVAGSGTAARSFRGDRDLLPLAG